MPKRWRRLRPHAKGQPYSRFEDLTGEYDLVLVPAVMDHASDVAAFLAQLNT
jgi:hypothetical protein